MGASASDRKKMIDTIKELGKADAYEIHQGKVLLVDDQQLTMNVEVSEITFYGVRLRSVVTDDTGLWVIPKVDSYVHIAQIEGGVDYVMVSYSEIDKAFIKIGGKTIEVTADKLLATYGSNTIELNSDSATITTGSKKVTLNDTKVQINDGTNGGLVKSVATASKLNTLEANDNSIKVAIALINAASALSSTTPVTTGMLAGFFSGYTNLVPIVPTSNLQLENPNATH